MKRIDVPCFVDIEQTPDSLHAHAIPEGIDIHPGNSVLVHGAPSRIGYGERVRLECSATVTRASVLRPVLDRSCSAARILSNCSRSASSQRSQHEDTSVRPPNWRSVTPC